MMKVRNRTLSIPGAALALTLFAGALYAAQADLTPGVDASGRIDSPPVFQEVNALCNVISPVGRPGDLPAYRSTVWITKWGRIVSSSAGAPERVGISPDVTADRGSSRTGAAVEAVGRGARPGGAPESTER
jgi:hypothetical protein